MIHALTYSIVEHLRNQIPEVGDRVIWRYDGVELTGREKPFITVEQLVDTSETLAAGRRDYSETFALQIGVFTRNVGERSQLSYSVAQALRQTNIPFYDTSGPAPILTSQTFVADVTDITPMPPEDINDETNRHRIYIDVEITYYRVNQNGLTFTQ